MLQILWMSQVPNIPAKRHVDKDAYCSPSLCKTKFVQPSFLSHPSDCSCCMCSTITLQTLMLYVTYIHAEIYKIKSEISESMEFFKNALHIYQKILKRQEKNIGKLKSEIYTLLTDDDNSWNNLQLLLLPLKVCFIKLARGYADFLASNRLIDSALRWNNEVDQKTELCCTISSQIYLDLSEQLSCIQHVQTTAHILPKEEDENNFPRDISAKEFPPTNYRTPLVSGSVLSRLNVPTVGKGREEYISPIRIIPRKFILSADDFSENENKKSVQIARKKQESITVSYEDSSTDAEKENLKVTNIKERQCSVTSYTTKSKVDSKLQTSKNKSKSNLVSQICQTHDLKRNKSNNSRKFTESQDSSSAEIKLVKIENCVDMRKKSNNLETNDEIVDDVFTSPCSRIHVDMTPKIKSYRTEKQTNKFHQSSSVSSAFDSSDSLFDKVAHQTTADEDFTLENVLPIKCYSNKRQITKSRTELSSVSDNKITRLKSRRKIVSDDSSLTSNADSEIEIKMQLRGRRNTVISSSSTSSSSSSLQENLNEAFITPSHSLNTSLKKKGTSRLTKLSSISENRVKQVRGRKKVVVDDDSQSSVPDVSDFENEIKTKKVRGRKKALICSTSPLEGDLVNSVKKLTLNSSEEENSRVTHLKPVVTNESLPSSKRKTRKRLPLNHPFVRT